MVHAKFSFHSEATGRQRFTVVSFSGSEAISRLFRYEIEIKIARAAKIDLDEMLNSPARFETEAFGKTFPVHGVLASIDELQTAHDSVHYKVVLVPRLWWLSIYKTNEIYTSETTIDEIIRAVLTHPSAGLAEGSDFDLSLLNISRLISRDYRCQFGESDFDFLSRLMENEGIFYYFDHIDGADKIIFGNDQNYPPIQQPDLVNEVSTQVRQVNDSINAWSCRKQRLPMEVTVRDYSPAHPSLDIHAIKPVDDMGHGTEYLYGEHIENEDEAIYLSEIRAEEHLCNKTRYYAESSVPRLRAGYLFNMAMHPNDDYNDQDYLVVEVNHEGTALDATLADARDSRTNVTPQYRNNLVATAATVQFRPPRVTPKPRFYGTMTAFIYAEGQADNLAQVDNQGRYRVHLPFDRADPSESGANRKASAWLRMAQPYVGQDQGMYFPMKNGTEVLLTFINGDPDQPIISGAVPNAGQPSLLNSEANFVRNVTTDAAQFISGNTHKVSMDSAIKTNRTDIDDHDTRLDALEEVLDPGQGYMYVNEGHDADNPKFSMLPPWEIDPSDNGNYNASYLGNASVFKFMHYDNTLAATVMKKIPPAPDPDATDPPDYDTDLYDSDIVYQVSTDRSGGDEYVYANRRVFAYPQHERVYFIGTFHEDFHVKDDFTKADKSWTGEVEEFHFPAPGGDGNQFEADGETRRSLNDINPDGVRGVAEDKKWGDQMNYAWGRAFNWAGGPPIPGAPEEGNPGSFAEYSYGNSYSETIMTRDGGTSDTLTDLDTVASDGKTHSNDFTGYGEFQGDGLKSAAIEKTWGSVYSYQDGFSLDVKVGNSYERVYGDKNEEVHGHAVSHVRGSTHTTHHGAVSEMFLGAKHEFAWDWESAIHGGVAVDLYGGLKLDFFFGSAADTYLALKQEIGLSLNLELFFAPKFGISGGPAIKKAFLDLEPKDTELADFKLKLKNQGTALIKSGIELKSAELLMVGASLAIMG